MDGTGRRLSVLIVDDNQDLTWGLMTFLRFVGFDVKTVHDGREALPTATSYKPDVVLLDIGLPGLDGFLVAEQLRNDANLKDIFIIAMSGYNPEMYEERSRRAYFDRHLVKPVDLQEINSLLSNFEHSHAN